MADGTADVVIVVARNPDTDGLDLDRIGTVETHPIPDARRMVETGEARWVDDPRNIDDGYVKASRPDDETQDTDVDAPEPRADDRADDAEQPAKPATTTPRNGRRTTTPPADPEPEQQPADAEPAPDTDDTK
jgi:hypothetical protein